MWGLRYIICLYILIDILFFKPVIFTHLMVNKYFIIYRTGSGLKLNVINNR